MSNRDCFLHPLLSSIYSFVDGYHEGKAFTDLELLDLTMELTLRCLEEDVSVTFPSTLGQGSDCSCSSSALVSVSDAAHSPFAISSSEAFTCYSSHGKYISLMLLGLSLITMIKDHDTVGTSLSSYALDIWEASILCQQTFWLEKLEISRLRDFTEKDEFEMRNTIFYLLLNAAQADCELEDREKFALTSRHYHINHRYVPTATNPMLEDIFARLKEKTKRAILDEDDDDDVDNDNQGIEIDENMDNRLPSLAKKDTIFLRNMEQLFYFLSQTFLQENV